MTRQTRLIAGLCAGVLVVALIAYVAFQPHQIGRLASIAGSWIGQHPAESVAVGILLAVAALLGFTSHRRSRGIDRGRYGFWIFLILVWIGVWMIYWIAPITQNFNSQHLGANLSLVQATGFAVAAFILNSIVHWTGELLEPTREEMEQEAMRGWHLPGQNRDKH